MRTDCAVLAAPSLSVPTFITCEGLTRLTQSVEQRQEQAAAFGERVFNMWGIPAIIHAHKQLVFFHIAQAPDESTTADRIEVAM